MRAKVKTARRKASKLHGATAGYVSLVDRGANETPFREIKSATKGVGAMGIRKRTTVAASHKKLANGKKAAQPQATKTVMAKMVFDQDHFEDEASVLEWIEKAEWDAEGVTITDDGDGSFVARPADTTDESFTRLAKVDAETEGVTAYVGEMLVKAEDDEEDDTDEDDEDDADDADDDGDDGEEDDDEADEEAKGYGGKKKKPMDKDKAKEESKSSGKSPANTDANTPAPVSKRAEFIAKAKSTVAKFSGWDAFYSKKSTLVDALKAGMEWDATPPGFYDVQAAFNGVVQSILGDETEGLNKAEALSKAAADYADLLTGMDSFFDGYLNAGSDTVTKAMGDKADKIAKWAEGYAQFIAGESDAPTPTKKAESIKKGEDAAPLAIDHKSIAELVAKAVEPLAAKVEDVAGTVTKLADRRQTRKAVDVTDTGTGQQPAPVKKAESDDDWFRRKQRKSLLGG